MTITCYCRLIDCDKPTTLAGSVDDGEAVRVPAGVMWDLSVPFNFAVNLKLLQK